MESTMEPKKPGVYFFGKLHPSELSLAFEGKIAGPPAVRWTRYGRWTDDAKQVLNNLGEVIYKVGPMYRRKR